MMRKPICLYCGINYFDTPYKDRKDRLRSFRKIPKVKHNGGWLCFDCVDKYKEKMKEKRYVFRYKNPDKRKIWNKNYYNKHKDRVKSHNIENYYKKKQQDKEYNDKILGELNGNSYVL